MRTIIAGAGDIVYFLAKSLTARGHQVAIVAGERPFCVRMSELTTAQVINGDPTLPDVLLQAGADEAGALLALSLSDPENLMSCGLARRVFGVPRTFALVNDPDNRELFARLGVTRTLSPVSVVSGFVSTSVAVDTIVNLFTLEDERFVVAEVEVSAKSTAVGSRLVDIALPEGAVLAAVIREEVLLDPRSDDTLAAGDRAVVIAAPAVQRSALEVLTQLR